MIKQSTYPFYKSIRFRFGLLFNFLLLACLSIIIFLLYENVKTELEKSFQVRLSTGANNVLQKTEVNPITIPLPQSGEYFLISYNNTIHTDTLFNNLPAKEVDQNIHSISKGADWWFIKTGKTLETGGIITIIYVLPAGSYNTSVGQLQKLLFIYIPIAVVISFVAGYFLSGIFLKPLKNIISKANNTDLTNNIKLLDEPAVKDELHELVDALNRMLKRIEKQSQQQNAFFASASHELRTPLSNMLTELQTIDADNIPQPMQAVIKNQVTEVQRLKKLVNNFLLMSQLKADNFTTNKTNCNIAELCIEIIQSLQSSAHQNKAVFKFELAPPDADFIVLSDKDHLSIILNNLIANAVKYRQADSIIRVSITKNANSISLITENKTDVRIDDVNNLKNEFKRIDLYEEGFGLGLWIADQLLKKNNGELNLSYLNKTFIAAIKWKLQAAHD